MGFQVSRVRDIPGMRGDQVFIQCSNLAFARCKILSSDATTFTQYTLAQLVSDVSILCVARKPLPITDFLHVRNEICISFEVLFICNETLSRWRVEGNEPAGLTST